MRYIEAKKAVEHRHRTGSIGGSGSPIAGPVPSYDQLFGSPASAGSIGVGGSAASFRSESPIVPPRSPPPSSHPVPISGVAPSPPIRAMSLRGSGDDFARRQLNPLEAIATLRNNIEGGPAPTPPPRRQTPSMISPASSMIRRTHAAGSQSESMPPGYIPSGAQAPPTIATGAEPYMSAEQEKAQLRAKLDQANRVGGFGGGANGTSNGFGGGSSSAIPSYAQPPPISDSPPPNMAPGYEDLGRPLNAVEEKARLRAQYEAEERANQAELDQSRGAGPPPPSFDTTPSQQMPYPTQQQQSQQQWQPAPPPNAPNGTISPQYQVPNPQGYFTQPNGAPPSPMPSQYAQQPNNYAGYGYPTDPPAEQYPDYAGGYGNGNSNGSSALSRDPTISQGKRRAVEAEEEFIPPPPPPLAPRPPAHYIQETQILASSPIIGDSGPYTGASNMSSGHQSDFSLEVRPFSPLDLSFDHNNVPFERPPLPPKVPLN